MEEINIHRGLTAFGGDELFFGIGIYPWVIVGAWWHTATSSLKRGVGKKYLARYVAFTAITIS